jgi:MoxR-like ATPase
MYVHVDYPDAAVEKDVLRLVRDQAKTRPKPVFEPISQSTVLAARREALEVYLSPELEEYLVQLVVATRDPSAYDRQLAREVEWGSSPRGTIALDRCARARAWLHGRSYVTPEDVHELAPDVLAHRVLLTYEAQAEGRSSHDFLRKVIQSVPLP